MAVTPSTMQSLGSATPDFQLLEPMTGNNVALADFSGKAVMVAFICNHCPFVVLIREKLATLGARYADKGIQFIAINSNDVENYPADSPEKMVEEVGIAGYQFPYLFDQTQSVAKAFGATCTPDLFLYDSSHTLFYRGQFDAARPGNGIAVTGEDLIKAMEALLAGQPSPAEQMPSIGCSIKWRS